MIIWSCRLLGDEFGWSIHWLIESFVHSFIWLAPFFSIGGFNGHQFLNTVEYYDIKQGKWITLPSMAYRRSKLQWMIKCSYSSDSEWRQLVHKWTNDLKLNGCLYVCHTCALIGIWRPALISMLEGKLYNTVEHIQELTSLSSIHDTNHLPTVHVHVCHCSKRIHTDYSNMTFSWWALWLIN